MQPYFLFSFCIFWPFKTKIILPMHLARPRGENAKESDMDFHFGKEHSFLAFSWRFVDAFVQNKPDLCKGSKKKKETQQQLFLVIIFFKPMLAGGHQNSLIKMLKKSHHKREKKGVQEKRTPDKMQGLESLKNKNTKKKRSAQTGNRTRVLRVGGEDSTTEPSALL